jgi:hypothetical protein
MGPILLPKNAHMLFPFVESRAPTLTTAMDTATILQTAIVAMAVGSAASLLPKKVARS